MFTNTPFFLVLLARLTTRAPVMAACNITQRLHETVAEGSFYEAQQMYKTLYFRYYSNKKIQEAKDILISGALTMLQYAQTTCATELSRLLLNIYTDEHTKVTKDALDPIIEITEAYPAGDQGKISTLKYALKWVLIEGNTKYDGTILYLLLARTYAEAGDFGQAQKYYMRGDNPQEYAMVLIKWISEGFSSETDIFIARAVLQYLLLSNLRDANILFTEITRALKTKTPLTNYIRFLLLTLEFNAYPLFETLRQRYTPALSRDPSFSQYLDHIAQVFYNVKPQNGAGSFGNFFSDMLKTLLSPSSGELEAEELD